VYTDEIGGGINTMKSIVRIVATLAIVLATTLGMNAQRKDKAMEQQVFYRTVRVNGLSIFYREAGPKEAFSEERGSNEIVARLPQAFTTLSC
jgi:hypothetical protein